MTRCEENRENINTMRKTSFTLALVALAIGVSVSPVLAADLVNADRSQLALQGYDPVAFHTDGRAAEGSQGLTAEHRGATYRFATNKNRELFQADPDRYAPSFGGYCAYGVSVGSLFPVEIETWQILDGRLVLNKNLDVRKEFDKDKSGNLSRADGEWPGLLAKHGK